MATASDQYVAITAAVPEGIPMNSIQKIPAIDLLGQQFISKMTRHTVTSCFAQVRFKRNDGSICSRPCRILYFFRHAIKLGERYVPHHSAFVEWLLPYPQTVPFLQKLDMHAFRSTCAPLSKDSILPVHRLYSGAAVQDLKIDNIYAIIISEMGLKRHFSRSGRSCWPRSFLPTRRTITIGFILFLDVESFHISWNRAQPSSNPEEIRA
ncbi:hypothetical protein VTP01DRAFT_8668 [Rhizomucor pusillus]|uniref:uncharacterized protein n=1 Tax=Rhizomucor pusillus TaxID=4840 RepID=UPI003741F33A